MGIENLSEIARQINPELWDKPESEGSDSIKVVHNFYLDTDGEQIVGLDKIDVKASWGDHFIYANKKPNTKYTSEGVYRLKVVFLNHKRNTMTITYEDLNEDLQFATWNTPLAEGEHSRILFKPIPQTNYR
ncbi:MAG: hypothetical protein Q8P92_04755 [Candidatus Daviesbacteria bacterium]|nr:hypothetical protein [Candidatus Daviesbacteria bacterium]